MFSILNQIDQDPGQVRGVRNNNFQLVDTLVKARLSSPDVIQTVLHISVPDEWLEINTLQGAR